jgi:carbonic anhydrase/acetyltransferase-like protein (isoleucine patch superfamily)
MTGNNVVTDFNGRVSEPIIDDASYVHPLASVIGSVVVGKHVMVSPMASIRGDEGQPIYIGDDSNVQDGVVIHGLETEKEGKVIDTHVYAVAGKYYSVYIGERVSLAHQVQIHGPAVIYDDTFVGMKSLIFKSSVGKHCVIEPGVILMGVSVADHHFVPAGAVITSQKDADTLPRISDNYPMKDMNKGVVHVNRQLAQGYLSQREQQ